MAGAGVKKFIVGEVLSDTEVNTYLMDQTVAVFPNAASRDAAFGDPGEPGLSEGRLCYLQSTKKIQFYNGTGWSDSSQFTVTDGTITTDKLDGTAGSEAVTTAKIRNDAVTADKLADSSSTDGDRAVTTNHIRDLAVTSGKLQSSITLAGTTTINGTGKIQQLLEKAIYSATPLTGLQTLNALNGAVYYYGADTTNDFQFNLTSTPSLNSLMAVQESITFALFCKQGTIAKRLTAITIDALVSGVVVRWFGGTSYPTGNNNSVDVYTVTVLKTSTNTFDVFASQSPFKV